MKKITGGIYPTMITPFRDGRIDEKATRALVDWYIERGCEGIFAVCQSSEMMFLSLRERVELAKMVVDQAAGRIAIVASGMDHRVEIWKTGEGTDIRTQIYHFYSEDGGRTWSEPKINDTAAEIRPGDKWEKVYCSVPNKRPKPMCFTVYSVMSYDGGVTWGVPKAIAHSDEKYFCEPAAVFSPDKKQIAVIMREDKHKWNSHVMFSNDNGVTWSEPRELAAALMGDRHCIRYTADGRLFISFRDKYKDSPTFNSWVGWVGTYDNIVNGREGQYRVHLMQNRKAHDCGYAGVEVLPDDTIVATSYGHFTEGEPAYVMTVRFKLSELDAKLTADNKQ